MILILSAYDCAEFRAEALAAGCIGQMVKPVAPGICSEPSGCSSGAAQKAEAPRPNARE